MLIEELQILLSLRPESFVYFLGVSMIRPFGLTYGFTLFVWGVGSGTMIRLAIAATLGMVVFVHEARDFVIVVESGSLTKFITLAFIEFAIGFGLGALSSAPFHAFKYAGAISDSYRGENNTGIQDPSGGELNTFSVLYFAIGAFVFSHLGGFSLLAKNLFTTYVLWPIGSEQIILRSDSWLLGAQLLERSLTLSLTIAAPLMIMFVSIDFILTVATKLGPRFNLFENSFLLKNIVAIAALPFIVIYILRISENNLDLIFQSRFTMEYFLK